MTAGRIAIIGAGISGLAVAIALRQRNIEVDLYEQAPAFSRVGAAINLTSNAVKVLDGLGIGDTVRRTAHVPEFRISRTWDTGEETSRVPLGEAARRRYGAAPLLVHRADLLSALQNAVPEEIVHFDRQLTGMAQTGQHVVLEFEDGSSVQADSVIGADGIHSVVRRTVFEDEAPISAGMSAYRATIPIERAPAGNHRSFVKWWGPVAESQIVVFLIDSGNELFVFATMPDSGADRESWSMEGDLQALRGYYAGYHLDARAILDACTDVLRTGLYHRPPLETWSTGRITLIGDACHAMVPFMAQGAAMGLEDAAILARYAEAECDWSLALKRYEVLRAPRAKRVQLGSQTNDWLRNPDDPDWLYGYDAWTVDLA